MTWRIWSPVGSTSSSNASFERSFSSDAASALDEKRHFAWKAVVLAVRAILRGRCRKRTWRSSARCTRVAPTRDSRFCWATPRTTSSGSTTLSPRRGNLYREGRRRRLRHRDEIGLRRIEVRGGRDHRPRGGPGSRHHRVSGLSFRRAAGGMGQVPSAHLQGRPDRRAEKLQRQGKRPRSRQGLSE